MEEIKFACHDCGAKLGSPPHGAGRKVSCPNCQTHVLIPDASRVEDLNPILADLPLPDDVLSVELKFRCKACAVPMWIDARGSGSTVRCPSCKTHVTVPPLPMDLVSAANAQDAAERVKETCQPALSDEEIEFMISFGDDDADSATNAAEDSVYSL